jgi:sugar lactone lactonase YvrE
VTQWSATANGIAVDASGKVYTTEGNAVVVYSTTTGTDYAPSNTWGATGSGDGQFDMPQGIAVDSSGNVFVADSANNRIQKFDSSGAFTTSWNYAAGISTPLDSPGAIAVDGAGNVYVASASDGYKFSSSGTFLAEFCDAKLRTSGIAVGASGAIYASVSHSIWKFR